MIKAIIFDLDRTLFNIDIPEEKALTSVHKHFVPEHIELDHFIDTYKIENEKWWQKRSRENATLYQVRHNSFIDLYKTLKINLPKPVEFISKHYIGEAQKHWVLYDGVNQMLDRLHAENYQVALVTNGFSTVQHPKLDFMDMKKYFHVITISDEVGFAKPDRKIFDITIDKLGIHKDEVVYVGDNLHDDYKGSQNAGIKFLWFNEHHHPNPEKVPEFDDYKDFFKVLKAI